MMPPGLVSRTGVVRIKRIALNAAHPERLLRFYADALGFAAVAGGQLLTIGPTMLESRAVGQGSRPYPSDVRSWSPLFQHCALVIDDMAAAMARLAAVGSWSAISTAGPQRLPAASGGVTAFKFRDPEGHPLEFIGPADHANTTSLIDHSAISVRDTARSIDFYENLGLTAGHRSLNTGIEQQHLDDVAGAVVEETSLELSSRSAPHVELLSYRGDFDRDTPIAGPDDIAATRLVFAVPDRATRTTLGGAASLIRDPDGHILEFEVED